MFTYQELEYVILNTASIVRVYLLNHETGMIRSHEDQGRRGSLHIIATGGGYVG